MLDFVKKLCEEKSCKLLYLTKMGSSLYGTTTETSDSDFKGVMLPNYKDVLCGHYIHNIRYESDNKDVEIYSIQEFFRLLSKGETISCDMLFAITHHDAVIYIDDDFRDLFSNVDKLISGADLERNPYLRYSYTQAVKYGMKGSRYKTVKNVLEKAKDIISKSKKNAEDIKLEEFLDDLIIAGNSDKYCFKVESKVFGARKKFPSLYLAGKIHQGTIKLSEFTERLEKMLSEFGKRTKIVSDKGGNDWKALSHAVRTIHQLNELTETGIIKFPCENANILTAIKLGKICLEEIQEMIERGIKKFEENVHKGVASTYKWDQKFVNEFIVKVYENNLGGKNND